MKRFYLISLLFVLWYGIKFIKINIAYTHKLYTNIFATDVTVQ